MQPHEKRVVDEKSKLDKKIMALVDFMHTDVYAGLPAVDQGLLMVQQVAMQNYSEALGRRIDMF
jgi:hypothetical protein